jgi:uncharacterized membrane protein
MTSRSIRIILVISVVFNVFVVGAAVGGAYRWLSVGQHIKHPNPQQRGLRFAASQLTAAQQMTFRAALREARRESQPMIEAARAGRTETIQALGSATFDQAAASAALARTRDADFAFRKRVEDAIVGFAQTLSPEDREKFVLGLEERGPLRRAVAPPTKR